MFDDAAAVTVRDILTLDVPTMASPELQDLYLDQAGSLNEIADLDRALGFCVC